MQTPNGSTNSCGSGGAVTTTVVHDEGIDAATLPALIAETARASPPIAGTSRTLNAVLAGVGTGSALIATLVARLRAEGCARLWVTTTNDNLSALRFYLRRGFRPGSPATRSLLSPFDHGDLRILP